MKPAYPAREFILRVLYFCLGTAVCALGCSAFVLSGIGTDPFSMLMQGVARTAHISNGAAHIAINFTLLVLYFFIDRKYIRAGTFAALFITGPMIERQAAACSAASSTRACPSRCASSSCWRAARSSRLGFPPPSTRASASARTTRWRSS